MNIAILGHRGFIGSWFCDAATRCGHNIIKFPGSAKAENNALYLRSNLSPIDAFVDFASFDCNDIQMKWEVLKNHHAKYIYISTISVYADTNIINLNESSSTFSTHCRASCPSVVCNRSDCYGRLKSAAEILVQNLWCDHLIIRPGVVVGPGDHSDRVRFWLRHPDYFSQKSIDITAILPVQIIDVRDLAEWIVQCIETSATGVFNVVGPRKPLPFAEFLKTCQMVCGQPAKRERSSADPLPTLMPNELPLLSMAIPAHEGIFAISNRKALDAGLTFRKLHNTLEDIFTVDMTIA